MNLRFQSTHAFNLVEMHLTRQRYIVESTMQEVFFEETERKFGVGVFLEWQVECPRHVQSPGQI